MPTADAATLASPPTYRERLVREGSVLGLVGAAGSVVLLLFDDHATDVPASTVGQLLIVAVLLGVFGPRGVRSAIANADELPEGPAGAGSGEPTPLWHLPLVVAVLATPLWLLDAPDAALRVTFGASLVGLAQAFVLARIVFEEEERSGRTFVRLPGSRILRGTKLGYWI
jgi:hypothetical protein